MKQGGGTPPAGWPASGTITYENVTAAYRPGLPPVLSNLSFTIEVSQHPCFILMLCKLTAFCVGCCKCGLVNELATNSPLRTPAHP